MMLTVGSLVRNLAFLLRMSPLSGTVHNGITTMHVLQRLDHRKAREVGQKGFGQERDVRPALSEAPLLQASAVNHRT